MARLPIPGGDDDTWGNVLNDFLGVAHNTDGTLINNAVTTGAVTDAAITEAKLAVAVQTKLNASSADATSSTKGVIQLTGDLGGTAASPTVPGLAGKANTSHTHTVSNITDLTATATELNYVTNVTSDIQAQINGKQASGSYAASSHTHTLANITDVTATATELNYVTNVTSDIQAQLNGKQASGSYAASSHTHTLANVTDVTATAAEVNKLDGVTATTAQLNFLVGVTSAIQTQLNNLMPTYGTNANGDYTRFPDGTQICRWDTYINPVTNTNTGKTWTFPAAFIAAPTISVTPDTIAETIDIVAFSSVTATTVSLRIVRSNTTDTNIHAIAIGRWK